MRARRPAGADADGRFGSRNLVPSGNSINRLKVPPGRPSMTNLVPTGNRAGSLFALYAMPTSMGATGNLSDRVVRLCSCTLRYQCVGNIEGCRDRAVIHAIPSCPQGPGSPFRHPGTRRGDLAGPNPVW